MQIILGIINIIIAIIVMYCMSLLYYRGGKEKSNHAFIGCQGAVVLGCISQVFISMAHTVFELFIAYSIGNLGICFLGSTWIYFSMLYSKKKMSLLHKVLPLCYSIFFYIMILTNSWHKLYYTTFTLEKVVRGPLFYINIACTYLCVIIGTVLIYKTMKRKHTARKRLIITCAVTPVLCNLINLTDLFGLSFDFTTFGFAVSACVVTKSITKYSFIDIQRELDITNERLVLERERNRIAQQVHDTVGHTLTMIQSYMKLADVSAAKEEYGEVSEYLKEARALTSNGIKELRESINMLRQEASYELVTQGVMQLANQVKEIHVDVTIKGEDNLSYSHLSKPIYDTVRESITNTLKYAEASKMDIILRFQGDFIELMIGDDGKGCSEIIENNGIRGIRERIETINGTVRFSTSEGEGFFTRIKLPV